MFLHCAFSSLVSPSISGIKLWLKNHIFTFSTSLKDNDGLKHIVTMTFQVCCTKNTVRVTDTDQNFCQ